VFSQERAIAAWILLRHIYGEWIWWVTSKVGGYNMPPLLKKHQKPDVANLKTEAPKKPLILKKTDSHTTSLPAVETEIIVKDQAEPVTPPETKPMKRLSATIDSHAFYLLKCYAAFTEISLVSALNDLIYKHCPVKISR
jgi:hypothetical protein